MFPLSLKNNFNSQDYTLERTSFPHRSCLNHLEIQGIQTFYIESLTGYLSRLSQSHNLPVGILMERELASLVGKQHGGANLHKISKFTDALNGTGVMASELTDALQQLTLKSNLKFLTLVPLAEVLPHNGLLRPDRAWCPACYEAWQEQGQIIFDPLLWTLDCVKMCPYHQCQLVLECPHCCQANAPLAWRSRPGYCSRCDGWLGSSTTLERESDQAWSKDNWDWFTWTANAVGELLAELPQLVVSFSRDNISRNLRVIVDHLCEGNIADFARHLQMPKNTVWLWCKGRNLPKLNALLRICYCLQLPLKSLLVGLDEGKLSWSIQRDNQFQKSSRNESKPFESDRVRSYLESIVSSEELPPPSMEEVARRLEYDRRTIYRHFRDLCQAVSLKYKRYRQESHLDIVEQVCLEIEEIVNQLHTDGEYPSEMRVSEYLSKPGYLRYRKVRNRLEAIRNEVLSQPID
ncbi:TniQ family protein [Leptolyngbya sp. AN02str]|uniref:TniQ family protein n=1 Tax=Leptolyngbya sp. AN02str TaxID=3423363 RepID=UPI003D314406